MERYDPRAISERLFTSAETFQERHARSTQAEREQAEDSERAYRETVNWASHRPGRKVGSFVVPVVKADDAQGS